MREKGFNWGPGLFIIGYHLFLLIALPIYFWHHTPSSAIVVSSIVLYFASGLGITAGYHRLFSHTSYKTHPFVEFLALFFGAMAAQGSAIRWSYEHRIHHAFVDTDKDPYSIKKGFWYAHMGWIFLRPCPIDPKVVPDLMKRPMVLAQHTHYRLWMILSNALAWYLVGLATGDFLGSFMIVLWGRMLFLHHSTWCINSLAHMWGSRSFGEEQTAVDNYLISLITFGEGYHNYHHTYANDYRNGIKWYHFDPTKWLIWTLSKLGLAHNLKRVDFFHVRERMVQTRKEELMQWAQKSLTARHVELQETIAHVSKDVLDKLAALKAVAEKYRAQKKEGILDKFHKKALRIQLKYQNKAFKIEWRKFRKLSKYIRSFEPSRES